MGTPTANLNLIGEVSYKYKMFFHNQRFCIGIILKSFNLTARMKGEYSDGQQISGVSKLIHMYFVKKVL